MITTARVAALLDGRVRLECVEAPGCGSCSSGRGCAVRLLGGKRQGALELPLDPATKPPEIGEHVRLSVADSSLLGALAWLFLPPSLGMLIGALLGHGLGAGRDGVVLAAAAAGLCVGFALARLRRSTPAVSIERQPEHARIPA